MRTLAACRPGAGLWRAWMLTLCLGLALTAPSLGATGLQPAAPSQAAEPEAKAWYDRPMLTPATGGYSIPSWSFAASDIRSIDQGGSHTTSTWASVTPSIPATLVLTSPGRICAAGQFGAVSVISTLMA